MLDEELRQPGLIAFGLPALFHDQHMIEIIAGQRPQHIRRFFKRQARTQHSLFVQKGHQPGPILMPSRLDLLRQIRQFGGQRTRRPQLFQ